MTVLKALSAMREQTNTAWAVVIPGICPMRLEAAGLPFQSDKRFHGAD
jgi:hypothetical protein